MKLPCNGEIISQPQISHLITFDFSFFLFFLQWLHKLLDFFPWKKKIINHVHSWRKTKHLCLLFNPQNALKLTKWYSIEILLRRRLTSISPIKVLVVVWSSLCTETLSQSSMLSGFLSVTSSSSFSPLFLPPSSGTFLLLLLLLVPSLFLIFFLIG